jgi:similar to stage IV sporulation protein
MYPKYTRFWLEKHGTKLTVDVRYAKTPPEVDSPYDICNIVSDKSGVIKKLVVRSGNPAVKENTFVNKGELIVSGIITNPEGQPMFVKADADVFAEVNRSFSESAPLISVDRIKTGRISKKYCIEVFGKSFNLFFKEPGFTHYDGEITNKPLKFFGEYFLPLSLRTYKYCEVKPTSVTRSASELEEGLKNNLLNTLKLSVPENNIISHEFVTTVTDTTVTVTLNVTCTENIAISSPITYETKPFVVSDITKKYITQD